MPDQFQDKVALVTGGGSGIGRATALAFAERGAKVSTVDISEESAEETSRQIIEAGGIGQGIKADVSKAGEVEASVKRTIEMYGRLDYAFNNAGIEGLGVLTADYSEEYWDQVINTNLKGVWLCMKYELPQMVAQGGGSIVNTSSIYGLVGGEGTAAYTASKHGVIGLTKTAAIEYSRFGIRVNAVCPGAINTPMLDRLLAKDPDGEAKTSIEASPAQRMAEPSEVAEAVVWLCSEAASLVTGTAMPVDGGLASQ